MNTLQDILLPIVQAINSYLSDYILIILLVGIGIYFTLRTRFVQLRCFREGIKKTFSRASKNEKNGSLSSFQALTTAIAAQVGTGNIVGACGAILIGGPGAIFWMWIIAFFGMATVYSEAVLAQKTKIKNEDGSVSGGPVYYIRQAFKGKFGKFLAGFFAVAIILALGFMGTMVQANSISEACSNAFHIPRPVIGLLIAALAGSIFIGGAHRIGSVTEKIVPIMAVLYFVGGLVVILIRIKHLPETLALIFKYAFNSTALLGGGIGYTLKTVISQGVKRGLFSNEAGMGSTPHAHALTEVEDPHDQGVVAMIGVFIDTFVVLTITALVVISTLFTEGGILHNQVLSAENLSALGVSKTNAAQLSFGSAFGSSAIGNIFIAVCLLFFAFSTIISWNLFGRINVNYLFGKRSNLIYSILSILFIFIGSIVSNDLAWELADMFNNIIVIPNVLALFVLSKLVVNACHKKKLKRQK